MRTEILQQQIDMLSNEHVQAVMDGNHKRAGECFVELVRLREELEKAKGENIIEEAKQSGKLEHASRVISLAHVVLSELNNIIGEVEDMFYDMKLVKDSTVAAQQKYYKAADAYFKEFGAIVEKNNLTMRMFEDIQDFDNLVKIWAKLKEQPKPQSLMHGCRQAAKQANGRSQMCAKCGMRYNPETIMCKACNRSFVEGFEKGARWLENKRVERIMNKNNEQAKETKETHILEEKN